MVDIPVSDVNTAKENLRRIKVYHELLEQKESFSHKAPTILELPNFIVDHGYTWHITLLTDNGEHTIFPFWVGYFETLYGAKVVALLDEEMEFDV